MGVCRPIKTLQMTENHIFPTGIKALPSKIGYSLQAAQACHLSHG